MDHWEKRHYAKHGPINKNAYTHVKKDTTVMRLHHTGPYTCDKCGIEVNYYASILAHWEKHLRPSSYQCDLCPKAFIWKAGVASHIRIVHVKDKEYKCRKCEFSAITARWLQEHMETYHDEKKECPICKKPVRVMSRHLKRHKIIPQCEIEKVSCPTCKLLVARKNLKGHIKRTHENLRKCSQCDKSFNCRDMRKWVGHLSFTARCQNSFFSVTSCCSTTKENSTSATVSQSSKVGIG